MKNNIINELNFASKKKKNAVLGYVYCDYLLDMFEEIERLNNIIKEVRDNLENSIKSINEKLKNNKEPFEVIDGRIQYINDYRVVRLKAFRTKCKELLQILDKENI